MDVTLDPDVTIQKIKEFSKLIQEQCKDKIVSVLVGNKMDLRDER